MGKVPFPLFRVLVLISPVWMHDYVLILSFDLRFWTVIGASCEPYSQAQCELLLL